VSPRPAIAGGLAIAWVGFGLAVRAGATDAADRAVHAALERVWWQPSFPLWEGVAVLAGVEVTTALAALWLLVLAWRRRWRAAAAVLAFPLALAVEALGKLLVEHPPPPITHAGTLTVVGSAAGGPYDSFPSGHVVRAVVLLGLAAAMWPRRRDVAAAIAGVAVAVVAFDRLYLSAHWLSDVVGGLLLGGAALAAAVALNPGQNTQWRRADGGPGDRTAH
jgi:membrane-associated phospholipid phosphatase